MNLTELLDDAAIHWPQKPAIIEESTIVSYAGLVEKINLWAERLGQIPLPAGSRIGLCYPNSVDYVVLTFALWRLNAVVVPLPVECPADELSLIAESMELTAMLSHKPANSKSLPLGHDCFFIPFVRGTQPDNRGLNIAFIRFTSGTTSARKGVVLCHETIRDRVAAANQVFRIGPEDTVMWCLPMAHHFLITIVLYLSRGATVVLARHVSPRPFLEATNRWRGTVLYAAPFHYALLARDGSGVNLPTVRLAVSTTCALPQDVATDFFKRFGQPLIPALGVIELGLVSANLQDPVARWNSVGKPAGDFQIRVIEPDAEGFGEIVVRGPGIFDAYASPWLSRDEVLRDGWFPTGDIGYLDADGYLFLVGRKSAVINLAGRKVFPDEIEAVINRHPFVRESRVFGRKHLHLGEVVEAELVLSHPGADLESIQAFCRTHLATFKVPSRFQIVDALPRTAVTKKILRPLPVAQHD